MAESSRTVFEEELEEGEISDVEAEVEELAPTIKRKMLHMSFMKGRSSRPKQLTTDSATSCQADVKFDELVEKCKELKRQLAILDLEEPGGAAGDDDIDVLDILAAAEAQKQQGQGIDETDELDVETLRQNALASLKHEAAATTSTTFGETRSCLTPLRSSQPNLQSPVRTTPFGPHLLTFQSPVRTTPFGPHLPTSPAHRPAASQPSLSQIVLSQIAQKNSPPKSSTPVPNTNDVDKNTAEISVPYPLNSQDGNTRGSVTSQYLVSSQNAPQKSYTISSHLFSASPIQYPPATSQMPSQLLASQTSHTPPSSSHAPMPPLMSAAVPNSNYTYKPTPIPLLSIDTTTKYPSNINVNPKNSRSRRGSQHSPNKPRSNVENRSRRNNRSSENLDREWTKSQTSRHHYSPTKHKHSSSDRGGKMADRKATSGQRSYRARHQSDSQRSKSPHHKAHPPTTPPLPGLTPPPRESPPEHTHHDINDEIQTCREILTMSDPSEQIAHFLRLLRQQQSEVHPKQEIKTKGPGSIPDNYDQVEMDIDSDHETIPGIATHRIPDIPPLPVHPVDPSIPAPPFIPQHTYNQAASTLLTMFPSLPLTGTRPLTQLIARPITDPISQPIVQPSTQPIDYPPAIATRIGPWMILTQPPPPIPTQCPDISPSPLDAVPPLPPSVPPPPPPPPLPADPEPDLETIASAIQSPTNDLQLHEPLIIPTETQPMDLYDLYNKTSNDLYVKKPNIGKTSIEDDIKEPALREHRTRETSIEGEMKEPSLRDHRMRETSIEGEMTEPAIKLRIKQITRQIHIEELREPDAKERVTGEPQRERMVEEQDGAKEEDESELFLREMLLRSLIDKQKLQLKNSNSNEPSPSNSPRTQSPKPARPPRKTSHKAPTKPPPVPSKVSKHAKGRVQPVIISLGGDSSDSESESAKSRSSSGMSLDEQLREARLASSAKTKRTNKNPPKSRKVKVVEGVTKYDPSKLVITSDNTEVIDRNENQSVANYREFRDNTVDNISTNNPTDESPLDSDFIKADSREIDQSHLAKLDTVMIDTSADQSPSSKLLSVHSQENTNSLTTKLSLVNDSQHSNQSTLGASVNSEYLLQSTTSTFTSVDNPDINPSNSMDISSVSYLDNIDLSTSVFLSDANLEDTDSQAADETMSVSVIDELLNAELSAKSDDISRGGPRRLSSKKDSLSRKINNLVSKQDRKISVKRSGKHDVSAQSGKDDLSARSGKDDHSARSGKDDHSARSGKDDHSARSGKDDHSARSRKDDLSARSGNDVSELSDAMSTTDDRVVTRVDAGDADKTGKDLGELEKELAEKRETLVTTGAEYRAVLTDLSKCVQRQKAAETRVTQLTLQLEAARNTAAGRKQQSSTIRAKARTMKSKISTLSTDFKSLEQLVKTKQQAVAKAKAEADAQRKINIKFNTPHRPSNVSLKKQKLLELQKAFEQKISRLKDAQFKNKPITPIPRFEKIDVGSGSEMDVEIVRKKRRRSSLLQQKSGRKPSIESIGALPKVEPQPTNENGESSDVATSFKKPSDKQMVNLRKLQDEKMAKVLTSNGVTDTTNQLSITSILRQTNAKYEETVGTKLRTSRDGTLVPYTPYTSPLLYFKSYRLCSYFRTKENKSLLSLTSSNLISPRTIFCRFAIQGTCNHDACQCEDGSEHA